MKKVGTEMPEIEVPRRLIEHFNQGRMKGVEEAGYFIYNGVKVYEKDKRKEFKEKDSRTMGQILHGDVT